MKNRFEFPRDLFGESEEEMNERHEKEEIMAEEERSLDMMEAEINRELKKRILTVNDDYSVKDFIPLMDEINHYKNNRLKEIFRLKALAKDSDERNKYYNMITNPSGMEAPEYREIAQLNQIYDDVFAIERDRLGRIAENDAQIENAWPPKWKKRKKKGGK